MTADAIPVKWIKDRIRHLQGESSGTARIVAEILERMVDDWERGDTAQEISLYAGTMGDDGK